MNASIHETKMRRVSDELAAESLRTFRVEMALLLRILKYLRHVPYNCRLVERSTWLVLKPTSPPHGREGGMLQ